MRPPEAVKKKMPSELPEKQRQYKRLHMLNNPWMSSYYCAQSRCNWTGHPNYRLYGGRGIKFLLSPDEIRALWIRDNAAAMADPTIDRIDGDGHYESSNCQFLERGANSRKGRKWNREKTHCKYGHSEWAKRPDGTRKCVPCTHRLTLKHRSKEARS